MRNQTFGVEVEMNHITRKDAAKIAADYFGTGRYEDTRGRNGYFTWSAWDQQGREWKFSRDVSICGDDDHKCEMVTPILKYEDMEDLQELVRRLRHAGAISNPRNGCGVHIHIGADGHDAKSLRNLANLMASHEELLMMALKLDRSRMHSYCKPVDQRFLDAVNTKKPRTMTELADIWYTSQNCNFFRDHHYNDSRYHMLNLHATFTKGTVEFRLFQFDNPGTTIDGRRYRGGIHAGQLKSYIQLCLAMSDKAKRARSIAPNRVQVDNPKYAMAGWLCNMGLVGDEFKTARNIFTRNLTGNTGRRYVA